MIVIRLQSAASKAKVNHVVQVLSKEGLTPEVMSSASETILLLQSASASLVDFVSKMAGVEQVAEVQSAYPLVSRELKPHGSQVKVGSVIVGGGVPVVIAGPCSVESELQMHKSAEEAKRSGAHLLRGGAYKPRTNPYSFQGLGVEGLRLLQEAGKSVGLPVVTEVMSPTTVDVVSEYADMLQIGTRNMANFDLLRAVGRSGRPVLLKRGMAATVDEWLQAAEYIVSAGNPNVILCERGIRSFDPSTRNILDLAGAVLAKQKSHLPVMVDPSHGTGVVSLIGPMSLAAIAAGVDGISLEMHPNPQEAFSDGDQALTPEQLHEIVRQVMGMSTQTAAQSGLVSVPSHG